MKFNKTNQFNAAKAINDCDPIIENEFQCIYVLLICGFIYCIGILLAEKAKLFMYKTQESNSKIKFN